jgi:RNA polymerase sigma factor (sigma-70 family)
MPSTVYEPKQEVKWCQLVIRDLGRKFRSRYARWATEELILNQENERKEEAIESLVDGVADQPFLEVEWRIVLKSALTASEQCVVTNRYWDGRTQRETAKACGVSQANVSRIQQRALAKLKEEWQA